MNDFIFKTNINCNKCKSAVSFFLDNESRINKWDVDLESPDKVLRIEGENIDSKEIIELINIAGFKIEEL